MMSTVVFRKELAAILRSQRFRWATLVLLIISALALFNGIAFYKDSYGRMSTDAEASYRQWLEQGEKNPHSGAHYGFYAYKQPSPISVFDWGTQDFLGEVVWLEAHNQNEVKYAIASDSSSLSRMGQLNLGFVFQLLLPLLVFLMAYDLFSKEREYETLALLGSTCIRPWQLFMGKVLAVWVPIAGLALGLVLLSVGLAYWYIPHEQLQAVSFLRSMSWIALFSLVYLLLMSILAGSVSASLRDSASALLLLAGFWLFGAFLLPRLGAVLAERIYPNMNSLTFDQRIAQMKETGIDGHGPPNRNLLQQTLEQYGVSRPEELPVNFAAISLQAGEEATNAIYDVVYGELFEQFRMQEQLFSYAGLLSPFQSFRQLSMTLSATDLHTHLDFAQQAEQHRRSMQKSINDYYLTHSVADAELWQAIPPFMHQLPGLKQRLQWAGTDMLVLLFWSALVAVLALFSLYRFKWL